MTASNGAGLGHAVVRQVLDRLVTSSLLILKTWRFTMRIIFPTAIILLLTTSFVCGYKARDGSTSLSLPTIQSAASKSLQPNSLCAKDERIIFSCPVKRPAKIVSLCASKDLTSERGYLQYRFGLPDKVELEFPKDRTGTQQKFQYTHYFRAQVDLT